MSTTTIDTFVRDYSKSLEEGNASIFAGAGLSLPAGYVNWKELLREIADELGLDVDRESDLISLAQYHYNAKLNRSKLNQKLIEEFTKQADFTPSHRIIANLPLQVVWTTNYDELLESAFREARKLVDVKHRQDQLGVSVPGRSVIIYKMHGDASNPSEAVLTKEDYELFERTRNLFSILLQGELVAKNFLFIGYSLSDPNIEYILSRIRYLLRDNPRTHYCLMRRVKVEGKGNKRANLEYEAKKLEHRIRDLQRYSIQTVLMDEYTDVYPILKRIEQRTHLRDVFVSGSAESFEPYGESHLNELCQKLGTQIIREELNLVSGFGLGIGGRVIAGAFNELKFNAPERLLLRPFPQEIPESERKAVWSKYRNDMIEQAGFCVFISGNKWNPAKTKIILADGVMEEFKICTELKRTPIPIGATGHAAKKVWETVNASLGVYFVDPTKVKDAFKVLGNTSSTVSQILKAVFDIVKVVRKG